MITGRAFHRKDSDDTATPAGIRNDPAALTQLLNERVSIPFERMTGLHALLVPLATEFGCGCRGAHRAVHPACADFSDTSYCHESWRLHVAELEQSPATHWHQCDHEKWCGVVPVRCRSRCIAAFKLARDADMSSDAFEGYISFLDLLVRDVMHSHGESLAERVFAKQASPVGDSSRIRDHSRERPIHHKVRRAVEYVENRLCDIDLSVHGIANTLGVHPDYLAHLFAEQMGQRMCRYIATRRVESAKNLLVTTDWQIKRITFATGHANPKWFSQHFRDYTGLTPSEYRRSKPCHDDNNRSG